VIALGLWVIGAAFVFFACLTVGYFVLAIMGKIWGWWHRKTWLPPTDSGNEKFAEVEEFRKHQERKK
jgi:hypothetical protein